jgi:hypothetical protein
MHTMRCLTLCKWLFYPQSFLSVRIPGDRDRDSGMMVIRTPG